MSEYIVDIEPISACLRIFHRGDVVGEDPYEFAATMVYSDSGKTVELKGFTNKRKPDDEDSVPLVGLRESICAALFSRGVNLLKWERRTRGKPSKMGYVDTKTRRLIRRPRE